MGKISKFLSSVLVAALVAGATSGYAANATEARDITIVILDSNQRPIASAMVEPVGIPQPAQSSRQDGSTAWKLTPNSHRFKVSLLSSLSPWIRATDALFSIPIQSGGPSVFTVQLPKLINARIPISEGASFGGTYVPITWGGSRAIQIVVNGQVESTSVNTIPSRLFIEETAGSKFARISYFENPKLGRQNFTDKDGDLIPDVSFSIQTRFGSVRHEILSSEAESSKSTLSVSQVPYIQKTVKGSTLELAVYEGTQEVTSLFPGWSFLPLEIGEGVAVGTFVRGQTVQLNYSFLPHDRKVLFSFRSNSFTALAEEVWEIPIVSVECQSIGSGMLKTFETLGECPQLGWRTLKDALQLAEKRYTSCLGMNKALPGGIARPKAVNKGKRMTRTPLTSSTGYGLNRHLDADKDGIACER